MKKAVIATGGKQYVVAEGEEIQVERLKESRGMLSFTPLLVVDDKNISVGTPILEGSTVSAEITEPEIKAEKVTAIRYKAKKRVRKIHGHRQIHTKIKILKITTK